MLTLEISCPFDTKTSTFTLSASLKFHNGEIVEHEFGTWHLTKKTRRFGRHTFAEFRITNIANSENSWNAGTDPEYIPDQLSGHYRTKIVQFIRRVARHRKCKLGGLWGGYARYGNWIVGEIQVDFYRLKPKPDSG